MAKLYEITERYQNLELLLDNADENVKQVLLDGLNEIKEEFNEKALNLVKYIKNICTSKSINTLVFISNYT